MKKFLICAVTILFFMILLKTINVVSFKIGYLAYPFLKKIDPDNAFVVLTIHHISQACIAFSIIYAFSRIFKIGLKEFGFNFNELRFNIKSVLIFTGIWSVIQAGAGILLIKLTSMSAAFSFPLNIRNFTGYFLFEILLSGTSEEIMFRALVITSMLYFWKSLFRKENQLCFSVILFSTIIFMFDHMNFSLFPLKVTYFNALQELTVLIFGTFYGYLFVKTKSIVGSILAHNLLNGAITIIGLALFLNFG